MNSNKLPVGGSHFTGGLYCEALRIREELQANFGHAKASTPTSMVQLNVTTANMETINSNFTESPLELSQTPVVNTVGLSDHHPIASLSTVSPTDLNPMMTSEGSPASSEVSNPSVADYVDVPGASGSYTETSAHFTDPDVLTKMSITFHHLFKKCDFRNTFPKWQGKGRQAYEACQSQGFTSGVLLMQILAGLLPFVTPQNWLRVFTGSVTILNHICNGNVSVGKLLMEFLIMWSFTTCAESHAPRLALIIQFVSDFKFLTRSDIYAWYLSKIASTQNISLFTGNCQDNQDTPYLNILGSQLTLFDSLAPSNNSDTIRDLSARIEDRLPNASAILKNAVSYCLDGRVAQDYLHENNPCTVWGLLRRSDGSEPLLLTTVQCQYTINQAPEPFKKFLRQIKRSSTQLKLNHGPDPQATITIAGHHPIPSLCLPIQKWSNTMFSCRECRELHLDAVKMGVPDPVPFGPYTMKQLQDHIEHTHDRDKSKVHGCGCERQRGVVRFGPGFESHWWICPSCTCGANNLTSVTKKKYHCFKKASTNAQFPSWRGCYVCPSCRLNCGTKDRLKAHMKHDCSKCPVCYHNYTDFGDTHEEGKENHVNCFCCFCGRLYTQRDEFTQCRFSCLIGNWEEESPSAIS